MRRWWGTLRKHRWTRHRNPTQNHVRDSLILGTLIPIAAPRSLLYIYIYSLAMAKKRQSIQLPLKHFSDKNTSQTMASPNPKSHFHARSVSLPSKPNPLVPQAEEHLRRIRSSEVTACSFSSLRNTMSIVVDFYDSVEDLLLFPDTQHALVKEGREEVLERSLSLLDLCSTGKDVIAQTKENMEELQSTLRRRRSDDLTLRNTVEAYLTSRKKAKKTIQNCLKNLKIKSTFSSPDQSSTTTVSLLREAEEVTFRSIESLLASVHGKSRSCSFFGKLMHSKRVTADERASNSEIEKVDSAVHALLCHKNGKPIQMEYVQKMLGEIDSSIRDLEEEVERLIRRLIKTRVSLLNILNH